MLSTDETSKNYRNCCLSTLGLPGESTGVMLWGNGLLNGETDSPAFSSCLGGCSLLARSPAMPICPDLTRRGFSVPPPQGEHRMARRRGTFGKAGKKQRFEVSTDALFTGSGCGMAAGQGTTSVSDPWLCGADGRGAWLGEDGEDTMVEEVILGITEYSRLQPLSSGAALAPLPLLKLGPRETLLERMAA